MIFNQLMTYLEERNPDTLYGVKLAVMMIGFGLVNYFIRENTGYHQFIIG